ARRGSAPPRARRPARRDPSTPRRVFRPAPSFPLLPASEFSFPFTPFEMRSITMSILKPTRRVEFDPRPQPPANRIVRPDRPGSTGGGETFRSITPAAPTLPDRAACEAALAKAEDARQEATKRADGLQEELARATALSEVLSAADEALRAAQARAFSN